MLNCNYAGVGLPLCKQSVFFLEFSTTNVPFHFKVHTGGEKILAGSALLGKLWFWLRAKILCENGIVELIYKKEVKRRFLFFFGSAVADCLLSPVVLRFENVGKESIVRLEARDYFRFSFLLTVRSM